ncbi:enhancer of mRNA-decapping protein 4-like isoform X2 [Actinia tenebrosa]|uniref:Enhancer of mRNA-decapping protein 4-like isoform X2 n=1 Tax=Actinia tenebrosa TaxID=6105 RepID=A0A6P8H818_ACTTE|nr:enhancer of mRNA-decapping protein 4-like isoform X2 [Actinia tenebrosa]
MANTTGMATKYLIDMLNIGGKSADNVGSKDNSENKATEKVEEDETVRESVSVTSSAALASPLNQAMSDMSLSEGEIPGFLDGSTPRISLHPINQTIQLKGDGTEGSMCVYGNQVEVISGQNANSNNTASNKIKINQMVKYDWDLKYYRGSLIALGSEFIAYTLKGRSGYVVRLLNPQTATRALIKGFTGLITDLAFAHRNSNTLACVDEGGNVFVWNVREQGDKIEYKIKLHVKRSPTPVSEYHRIFWCPYLPDDEDDEGGQDDVDDRSLAITHDNLAEVIDVAMVVARCDCNEVTVDMLEQGEGYVSIIDGHTKPITDGSLSPDNAVLATASEDGYVKFWQVADMMPEAEHKCLHAFQPHDGAPLSSIAFCDNHIEHEKDVPMWRFMITGAEYNREIKVWCTVEWTCLQTLRFTSPTADISSVLGDSYFKLQLDATARYLVLSDIGRRVLYVLLIHQDRSEGRAHISSITDFQLTQPLLSFVITKVKLFKLKRTDQLVQENGNEDGNDDMDDADNLEELDESELDSLERRKNLMVQLRLYSIHTKSLQELLVHLKPEPSVAPPTPSLISSLNTSIGQGARDALSDLSVETGTGTEASVDLDESDAASDTSASTRPKLIAPDAFTHTTKDASRPESNASNVSSGTLVSALEASQNSVEESVMSSVTSRLSDSTRSSTQETVPQNFFGQPSSVLTPTSLPLPATPPFSLAPDAAAVPIPTFKSSPITPKNTETLFHPNPRGDGLGLDVEAKEERAEDSDGEERSLTPVADVTVEGSEQAEEPSPASVGKDPIAVTKVTKSESTESDEPYGQDEVSEENTPIEDKSTMDSSWMTASDRHSPRDHTPHVNVMKTKKMVLEQGLVSSPVARVDIPPESSRENYQDLSSTLSELLQLVQSQQTHILTLRQEVNTYQTHNRQTISDLVRGEVEKLEETTLERVNGGLAQHSIEENQRLDKALRERQTADKKKQEHLTSTLSQAVTNSITGKLDKTLKNEMKNNVVPAVQKVLAPVQEQLTTTMQQKLTAADAVLKDSINKMVKNKGVIEAIGTSAASALQGPIQDSYRDAFQNTVLPAFERACQAMFHQINDAFQKGTHQYLEKVTMTIESQKRGERESLEPAFEQLQSQLQLLRSESRKDSTNLIQEVESVIQKQLATALHSLREEMVSRFESQVKASLQETVKAEVQQALQEMHQTYNTAVAQETATATPQQVSVDHKKRISDLLKAGHIPQAFQEALTAADLSLVVFVCEGVDSNDLFSQTENQLPQPVLLSLIQQLSVDLLSNTELKHRYLTEALMLLDVNNEVTREHLPGVLQGLCQQLDYAIRHCSGITQRNLKMLLMAAKSLLR